MDPSASPYLLINADVITPGERFSGAVEIAEGSIAGVYRDGETLPEVGEVFDADGRMIMPGFVDIHTHGAGGRDVCDGREGSLEAIARTKLREGVTTFFPTTLTVSVSELQRALELASGYMKAPAFAKTPAMHIEGPFINPNCVGAQNPAFVRPPDIEEIDRLREIAPIGLISLAVEMEGGMGFVRAMKERGIVTSAAHSAATFAQLIEAKAAGLTHMTHFCNQMTPLHHREIGLVGGGLLDDDLRIEIICDRVHLCDEMIALTFKYKPVEQMMLITDSMAASWISDGNFQLGGMSVEVRNGIARLADGTLAGSTLRYHRALKNVHEITGLPLEDLVRCTSLNQARSLGLERTGEIKPGYAADLVVLNSQFEPETVFIDGRKHALSVDAESVLIHG